MRLKPKSTVLHPRALWYRRFTDLQTALNASTVYRVKYTSAGLTNYKTFLFDKENYQFVESSTPPQNFAQIELDKNNYYTAGGYYFWFITAPQPNSSVATLKAQKSTELPTGVTPLKVDGYSTIGKYQINRYYACGSFDYMVKGSITGTTTQRLKGNIIPLTSMNIVHYDDRVQLSPDDLVVVEGHLYSVENPETEHKHQPKSFNVYYATLNSIL